MKYQVLKLLKENKTFEEFLLDSTEYSIDDYKRKYDKSKFFKGFVLYRKYSRKDVFRILNWDRNPIAHSVGGYMISKDKSNCAIFVNYHKEDNITHTTMYEDKFIDKSKFEWLSKSKRTLESPDVLCIGNTEKKNTITTFY